MKKTMILSGGLIAVLAIGAVPAMARDGGPRGGAPILFEELDADGDGQVTMAEMEAHRAARFAAADTNGDGALSAEELLARAEGDRAERMERRVNRMIERLDANEDGALSQEEMAARGRGGPERMFERLDEDGDGAISEAEFAEARDRMRDRADKGRRGE